MDFSFKIYLMLLLTGTHFILIFPRSKNVGQKKKKNMQVLKSRVIKMFPDDF